MSLFLKFSPGFSYSRSFAYFHTFSRQIKCRLKGIKSLPPVVFERSRWDTFCTKTQNEGFENGRSSECSPRFENIIEDKRKQAARSVIVQVHSEASCAELYEYCNKISPVQSMYHYSLNDNNHFVLVEFGDASCVQREVLGRCTHLERGGVPVRSSLLWFRARPRGRGRPLQPPPAPPPLRAASQPVALDLTLLKQWLVQAESVDDEIRLVEKLTRLDDLGSRLRFMTAHQMEESLRGMFPSCRALPFGSSVNGFGRIGCDLDLYLEYDTNQIDGEARLVYQSKGGQGGGRQQRQMEAVADLLSLFLPGCANVRRILRAKVPIIKFDHDITALQCDLSMSNMSGVYMSELLWVWGEWEPRVRSLVLSLKCWAEAVALTNSSKTPGPWITNFSLSLMAIFYLQTLGLLPTLDTLVSRARSEDVRWAEDINCTFLREPGCLGEGGAPGEGPGRLLRGFFEYYSVFDLGTSGISVCTGRPVIKPDHSSLYIVNPLERSQNVARNVSPKETERLRSEVRNALWAIDSDKNTLLDLITVAEISSINKDMVSPRFHHSHHHNLRSNRMVAVKDLFVDPN